MKLRVFLLRIMNFVLQESGIILGGCLTVKISGGYSEEIKGLVLGWIRL